MVRTLAAARAWFEYFLILIYFRKMPEGTQARFSFTGRVHQNALGPIWRFKVICLGPPLVPGGCDRRLLGLVEEPRGGNIWRAIAFYVPHCAGYLSSQSIFLPSSKFVEGELLNRALSRPLPTVYGASTGFR